MSTKCGDTVRGHKGPTGTNCQNTQIDIEEDEQPLGAEGGTDTITTNTLLQTLITQMTAMNINMERLVDDRTPRGTPAHNAIIDAANNGNADTDANTMMSNASKYRKKTRDTTVRWFNNGIEGCNNYQLERSCSYPGCRRAHVCRSCRGPDPYARCRTCDS